MRIYSSIMSKSSSYVKSIFPNLENTQTSEVKLFSGLSCHPKFSALRSRNMVLCGTVESRNSYSVEHDNLIEQGIVGNIGSNGLRVVPLALRTCHGSPKARAMYFPCPIGSSKSKGMPFSAYSRVR